MDILFINGSPRKDGVTAFMLNTVMDGVRSAGGVVELINLADQRIHHCTGDWYCWFKKPGVCMWDNKQDDTMAEVRERFVAANKVVLGTPVYVDGMTGLMKNMLDRMIPILFPFVEMDQYGDLQHTLRLGEKGKKLVLASCCGFPEIETFKPLVGHLERVGRNFHAQLVGRLLRPSGNWLRFPGLETDEVCDGVLSALKRAGREFLEQGCVSEETEKAVSVDYFKDKSLFIRKFNAAFEKNIKESIFRHREKP